MKGGGPGGGIGGPGYDDTELRNRIGGAEGGIAGLRSDLSQYSKIKDRDRLLGTINSRLVDLEKVGIKPGDIDDLRNQLKQLGDSQASGDESLERLVNQYKMEGKVDMAALQQEHMSTGALTDDDFGFSETFEFFPQGVTHDPVSGTDS